MAGRSVPIVLACLMLAACRHAPVGPIASPIEPVPAMEEGWRQLAEPGDRERLERLAEAWAEALAAAGRLALAEGPLLDPQAALPRAAPAPGPYRCRLIRLDSREGRRFAAYPAHFCYIGVDGDQLSLTKRSGSERPGGYLWSESDRRLVFLGGVALGREAAPPSYRADEDRDAVGVLERVGPFQYRLVLPWPRSGATLDVLELVAYAPEGIER